MKIIMNLNIFDFLQCPFCANSIMELFPIEQKKERTDIKQSGYVISGVIYCMKCFRWFPIREGILSMMPDTLRDIKEIEFLKKYHERLPEKILFHSKPFSIDQKISFHKLDDVERDKKQEIEVRDRESDLYEQLYPDNLLRAELEIYHKMCNFKPDDVVLDLGCGTGRVTKEFIDQCAHLVAVDFSFESLLYLQKRLTPEQLKKIHLVQVDICYLPFRTSIFDNVISTGVFCCIPSQDTRNLALDNVNRILKKNGIFIISVYNHSMLKKIRVFLGLSKSGLKEGYQEGHVHYYNHTPQELINWLDPHFQIIQLVGSDNRIPVIQKLSKNLNAAIDRIISKTPLALSFFSREMIAKTIKK
ncbi:MAG: hypothetical protein A2161_02930 [Candidatus Schekmanbacteria bacterium RBG_13_48_7]|uniref:Methyltransferase type 11 domain-containing protein n=1 Tax=Candidatus Schekmanbacteria bacterium RBG_13_48_7 TaxID=1817878 RepID=A0A1F7RVR0_9BACT|nr:MAG: hypothetical protein A2161_02930 [Candidatus Schekmanbacteria bacterium RBG_13_48_7]